MIDDVLFTSQTGQGLRLVNQMGCPWTREEWLELRSRIDTYFATNPDAQIAEERQAYYDRYFNYEKRNREPKEAPQPQKARPGYIYLLRGENTPWYKIGISKAPKERRAALGTQSPFRIITVTYYDVDDMEGTEAWWHSAFAHKRQNGEWFELDEYDVDLFIAQEGRPIL